MPSPHCLRPVVGLYDIPRVCDTTEISAEMERDKEPSTEENVLCSLDGEINSFMELFDHIFQEYPRLLSDGHYRQELVRTMQKLKQYIETIEGGRTK